MQSGPVSAGICLCAQARGDFEHITNRDILESFEFSKSVTAFTGHGALQAASVVNSAAAIQMSLVAAPEYYSLNIASKNFV